MSDEVTEYFTDLSRQRVAIEIQNLQKSSQEAEILREISTMSSAELGAAYGEKFLDLLDLR